MDKLTLWTTIILIVVAFIIVLAKIADNDDNDILSRKRATDGAFRDGTFLGTLAAESVEPAHL